MSAPRDDGGPAFPSSNTPETGYYAEGMTLRDYFAGKALQVVHADGGRYGPEGLRMVAAQCYLMADAMLAARAASDEALDKAAQS